MSFLSSRDSWSHSLAIHSLHGVQGLVDSLAELPLLEALHLQFHNPMEKFNVPLERLSSLRQLTIQGDDLDVDLFHDFIRKLCEMHRGSHSFTHLALEHPSTENLNVGSCLLHEIVQDIPKGWPLKLQHIHVANWNLKLDSVTLPHLIYLSSLDVSTTFCQESLRELWMQLNAASIHLEHIAVEEIMEALINYLQSYSGLKRMQIWGRSDVRSVPAVDPKMEEISAVHSTVSHFPCTRIHSSVWRR